MISLITAIYDCTVFGASSQIFALLSLAVMQMFTVVNYYLSLRNAVYIKYFNSVQILVLTILRLEKNFLSPSATSGVQTWLIHILAINTIVSLVGSCQRSMAASCIITQVYLSARYYNHTSSLATWLKFVTYFMISFVMIFFIQRIFLNW